MKSIKYLLNFIMIILLLFSNNNTHSQTIEVDLDTMPIPNNPIEKEGWFRIFSDEFTGNDLDDNRWCAKIGYKNNDSIVSPPYCLEMEFTTDDSENIDLTSGNALKIIATEDDTTYVKGGDTIKDLYRSATIWSMKRFRYGYFEAKLRIPSGRGRWPAFWLWSSHPTSSEIDIMEGLVRDNNGAAYEVTNNYHIDKWTDVQDPGGKERTDSVMIITDENDRVFSDSNYVYAIKWTPDSIVYFLNNKRVRYISHDNTLGPLDSLKAMWVILNLAIDWNYDPRGTDHDGPALQEFPSTYEIDYVRVYLEKLTIPSDTVSIDSSKNYMAGYSITAGGDSKKYLIDGNGTSGGDVDFIAGNKIKLSPGFKAKVGSSFNTKIDLTEFVLDHPDQECSSKKSGYSESEHSSIFVERKTIEEIDPEFDGKYRIVPNPNNGTFDIQFSELTNSAIVQIYDLHGKLILTKSKIRETSIRLDISNHSKGIYIVRTLIGEQIYTDKIIYQ